VSDASAGDFEDAQPNFADKNLPHRRCCCPPILFLWSLNLARTLRPPLSVGMSASGPSRHFAARRNSVAFGEKPTSIGKQDRPVRSRM